jgi:hypothetical protein
MEEKLMAIMTEDDYYEIKVYPKGNTYVAPLVRRYSNDWITWGDRITLTHGYYVWTWQPAVLDIKGDG